MKQALLIGFICFFSNLLFAQVDDLEAILDKELESISTNTSATFKSSYLQNGRTIECTKKGELEFRVHHRFGEVSSGLYNFFGLDESSSLISFDYGITDFLSLGIQRATINKCWLVNSKIVILKQNAKSSKMPISLAYCPELCYTTEKRPDDDPYNATKIRLAYNHQLFIARKFSKDFSLQLMPTLIHRNLVEENNDNDLYSIGLGGRYKFTNWVALTGEYYYIINKDIVGLEKSTDSWSLGIDIDTGGHVFQLLVTNSAYLTPNQFLALSRGKLTEGNLHIGFNLMRYFSLFD